jgi:hypothetical protein
MNLDPEDVVLKLEPRGQVVVGSVHEMDRASLERARAIQARDPSLPAHVRRLLAAMDRGDPAMGFTSARMPESEVAVVVRDPGADPARVALLSEASASDRTVELARRVMLLDEAYREPVQDRRVIYVRADGTAVTADGEPLSYVVPMPETPDLAARVDQVEKLREAAAAGRSAEMEGWGTVKLALGPGARR